MASVSRIAQAIRRSVCSLDDREDGVRYCACVNDFSSFYIVQTAFATHSAIYPDCTTVTFFEVKRSKSEVDHSP